MTSSESMIHHNNKPNKRRRIHPLVVVALLLYSASLSVIVHAVPSARRVPPSLSKYNSYQNETRGGNTITLNSSTNNKSKLIDIDDYDAVNDLVFGENHYDSIRPKHVMQDGTPRSNNYQNNMNIRSLMKTSSSSPSSSSSSSSTSNNHGDHDTVKLSQKKIPPEVIRTQSIRAISNSIIHDATQTVSKVLRGDVAGHVPAEIYGQTLDEEVAECNSIHGQNSLSSPMFGIRQSDDGTNESIVTDESQRSNRNNAANRHKLYGGAQYHRLLQTYHDKVLTKPISQITPEEVSLLIHGISDTNHDGSDLLRSVAILSSKRMDVLAGTLLKSLAQRIEFIFHRMWKVVEYTMTTRTLGLEKASKKYGRDIIKEGLLSIDSLQEIEHEMMLYVKEKYHEFVQQKVTVAYRLASGDIDALMKFVSWDIAFANGSMGTTSKLSSSSSSTPIISTQDDDIDDWEFFFDEYDDEEDYDDDMGDLVGGVLNRGKDSPNNVVLSSTNRKDDTSIDPETQELLLEIMHAVRNANPIIASAGHTETQTYAAVNTLVQHVTYQWRLEIARMISTKFNSFCLVAFHDEFGTFLRKEMNEYIQKRFDSIINNTPSY